MSTAGVFETLMICLIRRVNKELKEGELMPGNLREEIDAIVDQLKRGFEGMDHSQIESACQSVTRVLAREVQVSNRETAQHLSARISELLTSLRSRPEPLPASGRHYVGWLDAVGRLSGLLASQTPSLEALTAVGRSKYGAKLLGVLWERNLCKAGELAESLGIRDEQLSALARSLQEAGVLKSVRQGKNVWYSLTNDGYQIARQHANPEWLVRTVTVLKDWFELYLSNQLTEGNLAVRLSGKPELKLEDPYHVARVVVTSVNPLFMGVHLGPTLDRQGFTGSRTATVQWIRPDRSFPTSGQPFMGIETWYSANVRA